VGALTVTPQTVLLTDRDTNLTVKLSATGTDVVRYRVELDGPQLSIAQPRGQFTGSTDLKVAVDGSQLKARNLPGTIKVFTTLGNAIVNAPIHVGITGSYKGKLTYDGGPINLGETHLALDILESSGDVQMRVDSHNSMLFPATGSGETTGRGSYTLSGGVDATVGQVIPASFGGARNHFRRDVGRQVRFRLTPDSLNGLSGTFDETIVGLFAEPVTTSGHVALQYTPQDSDPSFTLGADVTMPASPAQTQTWDVGSVFPWQAGSCGASPFCGSGQCNSQTATEKQVAALEQTYANPLAAGFQTMTPVDPTKPFFADMASNCQASLAATSLADYQASAQAQACGLVAGTACAMQLATAYTSADATLALAVGRLTQETLAPGLLVAKNEIVQALDDSFVGGLSQEQVDYNAATTTLAPFATWVTQPAILEYLRGMPVASAKGADPGTDTQSQVQSFPAARALADLFFTMSTIDGETARVAAASGDVQTVTSSAQQRAVLAYLESATLSEILKEWTTAPPSVGAKFTGVLTPLDQGFTATIEGADVFGIPDGFVPFVYRPEDVSKGATNFEQMLAVASNDVSNEQTLETQFLANNRAYEAQAAQLQQELLNVRTQYDERIGEICGTAFNPAQVMGPDDWSNCGANNAGSYGLALENIDEATAKLQSAQTNAAGIQSKIQIDTNALAATQQVHADTIAFIDQTGNDIAAIDYADSMINAFSHAMDVASHADLLNAGAPLAESAVVFALDSAKAELDLQKDQLQTAQTMQIQQAQAQVEYIQGMANIQKEMIDLGQATVDGTQQIIAVVEAKLAARNLFDQVQQIWQDRQRQIDVIDHDPTRDPSYRLLRDSYALNVLGARAAAQTELDLAGRALEYELNVSMANLDGAVLNAQNSTSIGQLQSCLRSIFDSSRVAYGSPQDYVTTVSVRQMLSIQGPRKDEVTGQTLSEGDQFRELLLKNQNLDGRGGVGLTFSTNLQAGNGLWASDVCNDRIASVQAQLVGDFLGDNQAQINLAMGGGGVMRACDSEQLVSWSLGSDSAGDPTAFAVVQAGVNTFGDAPANTSLFGQPVARANWVLVVPGGQDAPTNADVDITHIDDVVLKFDHKALPRHTSPISVDLSCLANVGK